MSETTSNILAQDSLSRKSLAFCGYTGYAAIILFVIGGVWLGGMLPPIPNANDTPAELVAKVNDNLLNFRIGSIFMIASFALFGHLGRAWQHKPDASRQPQYFLTYKLYLPQAELPSLCWWLLPGHLWCSDRTLMSRQFFSCGPILHTFWHFSPYPCLAAGAC